MFRKVKFSQEKPDLSLDQLQELVREKEREAFVSKFVSSIHELTLTIYIHGGESLSTKIIIHPDGRWEYA